MSFISKLNDIQSNINWQSKILERAKLDHEKKTSELFKAIESLCPVKRGDIVQMKQNANSYQPLKVTHRLMIVESISFEENKQGEHFFAYDGKEITKDGVLIGWRLARGWDKIELGAE